MLTAAIFPHPLLPLLLLVQQLPLPADIAAIAFRRHVLAQRRDRLAGDDLAADRRLDRDLEHVARDQVLEPLAELPAARLGRGPVDDHAQRVDRLGVDQDVHLDEVALAMADLVIVEARIAARDDLQPVVEIEHHLVQRQLVGELRAARDIGQVLLDAAPVLAELQDRRRDARRARRSPPRSTAPRPRRSGSGPASRRDCGSRSPPARPRPRRPCAASRPRRWRPSIWSGAPRRPREGAVVIRSRSYSRVSRSWMISR